MKKSMIILVVLTTIITVVALESFKGTPAYAGIPQISQVGTFQMEILGSNMVIMDTRTGGFEVFSIEWPDQSDKHKRYLLRELVHNPLNPQYIDNSKDEAPGLKAMEAQKPVQYIPK